MVKEKSKYFTYICISCGEYNWKKQEKCFICGSGKITMIKNEKDRDKAMKEKIEKFNNEVDNSPEYAVNVIVNTFSNEVCKVLIDRKIKKKDWADKLGLSKYQLRKFLEGNSKLTIEEMIRIAWILDIKPKIVFEDKEE